MSEQQTQRGKIRLVPNIEGEETYEKVAISLINEIVGGDQEKLKEYVEDWGWEEGLSEASYDKDKKYRYMIINKKIYEVLEEEEIDGGFFCDVRDEGDGVFSYFASWYNGGGSIEEILERELK